MANEKRTVFQGGLPVTIDDNTTKNISPADVRGEFTDLSDSSVSRLDDPYFKFLGTSGGTSVNITLTNVSDYPSDVYSTGMPFVFKITTTSGASPTLNINGLGAKNIYDDRQNQITSAGNLVANRYYAFSYDANAGGTGVDGFVIILRFDDGTGQITRANTDITISQAGIYLFYGSVARTFTIDDSINGIIEIRTIATADLALSGSINSNHLGTIYQGTAATRFLWDSVTSEYTY